eukprot:scaffold194744_cov30-Tisochrysis_lutea.AAC.8
MHSLRAMECSAKADVCGAVNARVVQLRRPSVELGRLLETRSRRSVIPAGRLARACKALVRQVNELVESAEAICSAAVHAPRLLTARDAQVLNSLRQIRPRLHRRVERRLRLIYPARLAQQHAKIVVRGGRGVGRPCAEAERGMVSLDGLRATSRLGEHVRAVKVGLGEVRPQLHGSCVPVGRLFHIAKQAQRECRMKGVLRRRALQAANASHIRGMLARPPE